MADAVQRILLAEDDPELRESLAAVLELVGWKVEEAGSLEAARRAADRRRFDLLITDSFGASLDQAPHAIATLVEAVAPTPVGVMTAWTLSREKLGEQVCFVLHKPFEVDLLVAEAARALAAGRAEPSDARAAVVRDYFRALSASDWQLLGELVADDVEYELPGSTGFARQVRGREAFVAFSKQTFAAFPGARFEEVSVYALPTGLAARYQARWPGPDGGEQGQAGAVLFQFQGERIAHIGVRIDDRSLASQVTAPR